MHFLISARRLGLGRRILLLGLAAGIAALGCRTAHKAPLPDRTALDRYVAQPDPVYAWNVVEKTNQGGAAITVIDMTSQSWLTTNEVSRTVWRHWLTVVRPDGASAPVGLLFITGGSNKPGKPPRAAAELVHIAKATRSVVAELRMVPNQPLVFGNDGEERVEDNLIGYTWDKFLRTGDERWPARLPMTKAAVRAMDTVTAFCASPGGGALAVNRFVVAGASKRGWTTWTTAAVDPRVVGICPIVIDVLNLEPSMQHHYQAYGFWAPSVKDYVRHRTFDWFGTSQIRNLNRIEDPYEYRERLTMPKLILNACGDQFFLPDSSQFYFKDLPGIKYLRYVPNADHSLKGSDAFETLQAWHYALVHHAKLPRFSWTGDADGSLRVLTESTPREVRFWQANNPVARDFRLETLGPAWTSRPLAPDAAGAYTGAIPAQARGWTAFFIELTYDIGAPTPLKLTTDVHVSPASLAHAPYHPRRIQYAE